MVAKNVKLSSLSSLSSWNNNNKGKSQRRQRRGGDGQSWDFAPGARGGHGGGGHVCQDSPALKQRPPRHRGVAAGSRGGLGYGGCPWVTLGGSVGRWQPPGRAFPGSPPRGPVWGSGLIRGRAGCSLGFASGHLNFKRAAGLNECS